LAQVVTDSISINSVFVASIRLVTMKSVTALCCVAAVGAVNPVSKVLTLLGQLEEKVTKEGATEQKLYTEYTKWCRNGKREKGYEIKTANGEIEDLTATIGKATSDIDASKTKMEELAGSIGQDDNDLKAATTIRTKERAEFTATEAELMDAVGMLDRAINILQRKMKGSSSMLQARYNSKDLGSILSAVNAVVDAAALTLHDKKRLLALAQSNSDDEDDETGPPAPDAYKAHSGSIVDVLEDMREKAQGQLKEARKEEGSAGHNFAMLRQSLEDQISADSKEMAEAKSNKAKAQEVKAVASGDLTVTKKDLGDDKETVANLDSDCQSKAEDHETSTKGRAEELKALAVAKKAIASMTGGAQGRQYGFLQLDNSQHAGAAVATRADLANLEVVNVVRQLAKKEKSAALMQLAGRIASTIRYSQNTHAPVFDKVKSMISDMIAKLVGEAKSEASHKEYCDKEMGQTKDKMDELQATISKLSAKKDKAVANSVKLKGETQDLQAELAQISKSQAEADKLRSAEHKAFVEAAADLKQGIQGVRTALKVLREYYASDDAALLQQPAAPDSHSKNSGAGGGIIGMLEVIASDFGKSLAAEEVDEDTASVEYEKTSQMNRVTKEMKEKDVQYKTKEATSLDKSTGEMTSDVESAGSELDAIMEYKKGIIAACVAKPESYEERSARRKAEVDGLNDALKILEGQAFLQKSPGLRGSPVFHH